MRTILIATTILALSGMPVLAQESAESADLSSDAQYYVVVDTVGNCSVIHSEPSPGLKPIGQKGGFAKEGAAEQFLTTKAKSMPECKGLIAPT